MTQAKDISGKTIGHLLVIERDRERQQEITKRCRRSTAYWKCKCECGKIVSIQNYSLTSGKTRSCGCQARSRVTGPSNFNFKGYKEIPLTLWSQIKERSRRCNF